LLTLKAPVSAKMFRGFLLPNDFMLSHSLGLIKVQLPYLLNNSLNGLPLQLSLLAACATQVEYVLLPVYLVLPYKPQIKHRDHIKAQRFIDVKHCDAITSRVP
jgi:hypothetical protein